MKKLIWSFVLFTISIVVTAQTSPCPVHYQRAITRTQTVCNTVDRNQACYGNNTVNLTPFSDMDSIQFNNPGDVADVETIRVLSLSALNDTTGEWGITMMRLLANLDPSSTDDITMLLFGDVEVEATNEPVTPIPITTRAASNIRRYPTTSAVVVASVAKGTELDAIGRNADSTWIQVHDTLSNVSGWMHIDLLLVENAELLTVVDAYQPYYGPLQAFYFRGQVNANQFDCNAIPSDGLFIQTPEGVGRVTLWINEVTVDFLSSDGSTVLVSPEVDNMMTIDVLEGSATIQSDLGGYIAVAGSSVSIETNTNNDESPHVNPPKPSEILSSEEGSPAILLGRDVQTVPADVETIATSNGLTVTQYEEVVEYGYVVTTNDTVTTTTTPEQTTQTDTTQGQPNPSVTNGNSANAGNNQDCPGNSCNAPGNNKDKDNNGKAKGKNK